MNGRLTRHNENQACCRRFNLPLPVQTGEQMKKPTNEDFQGHYESSTSFPTHFLSTSGTTTLPSAC